MNVINTLKASRGDCSHMKHWFVTAPEGIEPQIRPDDMAPCPKCGMNCAKPVEVYQGVQLYQCHTSDGRQGVFFEMKGCGNIEGAGMVHTGDLVIVNADPDSRDIDGKFQVWEIIPLSPHRHPLDMNATIRDAISELLGENFNVEVIDMGAIMGTHPQQKPFNKQPD